MTRRRGTAGAAVLAVLLAGLLGACSHGPEEIRITIHHSAFSMSSVTVPANATVRFVIVNTDPIAHEFILGDQAVQDRHEKGTEATHDGPGEISIPAGETRSTTYTFGPAGTLLFGCHLPGHYAFGMRGTVRVEA